MRGPTYLLTLIALCSVFLATPARGLGATNCPDDPFLDPKNDVCNPLKYIPSNALTAIALSEFSSRPRRHLILLPSLFSQWFWKDWCWTSWLTRLVWSYSPDPPGRRLASLLHKEVGGQMDACDDDRSFQWVVKCPIFPEFISNVFFINRLAFAMGIAVRFALHSKPDTIGIYIFENFFVVLSVSSHMNSSFHLLYTADLCSNN